MGLVLPIALATVAAGAVGYALQERKKASSATTAVLNEPGHPLDGKALPIPQYNAEILKIQDAESAARLALAQKGVLLTPSKQYEAWSPGELAFDPNAPSTPPDTRWNDRDDIQASDIMLVDALDTGIMLPGYVGQSMFEVVDGNPGTLYVTAFSIDPRIPSRDPIKIPRHAIRGIFVQ